MSTVSRQCWCGAKQARRRFVFRFDQDKFRLVECDRCSVLAMHPMPPPKVLAKYYAADYYGADRKKFIGPIAKLVGWFQEGRARLVAKHLPDGGRLLDIGCGNGGFLAQMDERGFDVEGTEWSAESAARVPAEIPVHVGDLLNLELEPNSFDAITLWHVFEHLAQPDETLAKIHELLLPGGVLFLSMPNQESWQAHRFGKHWFHLDPPRHLHGFGPRSLSRVLKKNRFRIANVSTWSMEQNPYGFIQGALNQFFEPRDRAYAVLKGTSDAGLTQRLLDVFLVGALTPLALVYTTVESLAGRGGTFTIVARKRP